MSRERLKLETSNLACLYVDHEGH